MELSYFSQLTVSEVEGLVQIYRYWITFILSMNGLTGFTTLEVYLYHHYSIYLFSIVHFSAGTFLCTTIHRRHIFGWPRAENINFKWNSGDRFLTPIIALNIIFWSLIIRTFNIALIAILASVLQGVLFQTGVKKTNKFKIVWH